MKTILKIGSIFILALCLAFGGMLLSPVQHEMVSGTFYGTTLTANITSPANGAVIQVGNCFTVTATISISCAVTDQSFGKDYLFSRPVYAFLNGCNVENVGATIAVTGNAVMNESATKYAGTGLGCPELSLDCPTSTTLSWQVCCTGPGPVTITVTPYGESLLVGQAPNTLVQPVYANNDLQYSPLPSENLISDSITITQVDKDDFYDKWLMDSSGATWARPSNIRTLNAWAKSETVLAGQQVIIYANVANRGDIEGPYTATLKINGVEEAVKTGMLQGNAAIPLEFVVSRDKPGTYEVDVNGKTTFFTVIGEADKETSPSKSTQNLLLLWGFLLLALIVALSIIILRRRQS